MEPPFGGCTNCNTTYGATVTWTRWNGSYTDLRRMAGTSTSVTCAETWPLWNQSVIEVVSASTTYGTSTAVTDSWPVWIEQGTAVSTQTPVPVRAGVVSEAEAQARLRRREADHAAYLVAEGERAKARERAEKLLMESLDDRQRADLAQHGHFTVHAPVRADGSRHQYRIRRGRSRNIQQVSDAGTVIKHLCVHPVEAVPDADTMLAQKLWLETQEEELLRIANHS